jgi:hypothetical protein
MDDETATNHGDDASSGFGEPDENIFDDVDLPGPSGSEGVHDSIPDSPQTSPEHAVAKKHADRDQAADGFEAIGPPHTGKHDLNQLAASGQAGRILYIFEKVSGIQIDLAKED